MKIRPVGAELFHASRPRGGRTDRHDEANIAFHNFAQAPKIYLVLHRDTKRMWGREGCERYCAGKTAEKGGYCV
jgi:hypothetical protein